MLDLLPFSFSLKHFSGHFYGLFFIKTVRGPLNISHITANKGIAAIYVDLAIKSLPKL